MGKISVRKKLTLIFYFVENFYKFDKTSIFLLLEKYGRRYIILAIVIKGKENLWRVFIKKRRSN